MLAAIAICSHFHIDKDVFKSVLLSFAPAHHRMEVLGVVDGVTYVDDSKATNVASTIACVQAFGFKKILLMGGRGKDISYDELFGSKFDIKEIVCFGEEGENIKSAAERFGYFSMSFEKMKDAVLYAIQIAKEGDIVLLSPACSSFDEFENYAERGEKFKEIVLGKIDEKK